MNNQNQSPAYEIQGIFPIPVYQTHRELDLDSSEKKVTSGRNFSVVHDSWGKEVLEAELKKNLDMYKLRRKGNAIVI